MTRQSQYHGPVQTVTLKQTPGRLTKRQLDAIKTAMRLFVEEDLERGVPPQSTRLCTACECPRFAPGFVFYGDARLCNQCATDYEIFRAQGAVNGIDEFLARPVAEAGASSGGAPSTGT